jgi:hypothetical protein
MRTRSALSTISALALTSTLVVLGSASAGASDDEALDGKSGSQDPSFTFAVVPDTQQEVLDTDDPRFLNRMQWLTDNRARLDLRFVMHIGDITNWGWLVPSQYEIASDAMLPLERAGIPYTVAIGNHDTRAVGWDGVGGYGGSAYAQNPECLVRFSPSECDTRKLVMHTEEFNAVFPPERIENVGGTFEPGKSDNMFTTYRAGGRDWLVLVLELWPRAEAVEWAKDVVAAHPDHNVIVNTHSYLNGNLTINQTDGGYGHTSGQYLYDELISRYENIKLVFSGHTGIAGNRTDVGVHGNEIHSFLQTFHSNSTNPVRLVTVDTRRGTLETTIVGPYTGETFADYDVDLSGIDWE